MVGRAQQVMGEGTSALVRPPGGEPTAQCVQWRTVLSVLSRGRGVECVTVDTTCRTPQDNAVSGSTITMQCSMYWLVA